MAMEAATTAEATRSLISWLAFLPNCTVNTILANDNNKGMEIYYPSYFSYLDSTTYISLSQFSLFFSR